MADKKGWKEGLLRSGLPLENDVRTYLESRECVGRQPHSYVRRDVGGEEREHSYDVNSVYISGDAFFDLMVECKYRHPSTKWLFSPATYGGIDEDRPTHVLHAQDYFSARSCRFRDRLFPVLGSLCEDGVELTATGPNEHTITHGVAQLLHAMPGKIVEAIANQTAETFHDTVFYRVPVLVTTADLFRLREGMTLYDVRDAEEIGEVADQVKVLVLKRRPGVQLEESIRAALYEYMEEVGRPAFKAAMKTFTHDPEHLVGVVSSHYGSAAVAIVQYDRDGGGLRDLMDYVTRIATPDPELLGELLADERQMHEARERYRARGAAGDLDV